MVSSSRQFERETLGSGRTPGPLGLMGLPRGLAPGPAGRDDLAPNDHSGDGHTEHKHHFRLWYATGKTDEHAGFDGGDIRTMQSQLVPVGGHRRVGRHLRHRVAAAYSDKPYIADVQESAREFRLRGLSPGSACIHAVNERSRCRSALAVVVKKFYAVPVAFHRIRDQQGRHSKRGTGDLDKLLKSVNAIYEAQTCLTFRNHWSDAVKNPHLIDRDLGDAVDVAKIFLELRKHAVPDALNIFFVWELQKGAGPDDVGGLEHGDHIFLADRPKGDAGRRLAHEIGHVFTKAYEDALGYVDSHAPHAGLMDRHANSTRITRREAECMYKVAVSSGVVRGAFLDKPPRVR